MGSLISNLTKSGVQQPSGATQYYGDPASATAAASKQIPSPDSIAGPDILHPNTSQPSPLPRVVQPTIAEATSGGSDPFSSATTTKGKILSGLLLAARGAAAGAAASVPTNPHISPGLGPALSAGFETPLMMKQQQNELEKQGAQNRLIAAQSQMVTTPYGQMPEGMAKLMFPAMINAAGKVDAAKVGAVSRENVADTQSQTTKDVKRFTSTPAGVFDAQTQAMVPETKQGITITPEIAKQYGMPDEFIGKPMKVSEFSQIEKAQASQAGTTTNTIEYRDDGQGNIVALPKTTTTKKNLPGATPSAQSSGTGGGAPRVVISGKSVPLSVGTDSDGNQVAGTPAELKAAGVAAISPLGSAESAKVNTARQLTSPKGLFAMADRDLGKFKPGELEALSPRWNEFLAGKVGTDDPRYVALRTHVNGLLSTALMQAHVGARGGEQIMEHFQDMANAGKMSKETLKAALDAEREYIEEKAMRPNTKPSAANPKNGSSPKAGGGFFDNIPGATTIKGPR